MLSQNQDMITIPVNGGVGPPNNSEPPEQWIEKIVLFCFGPCWNRASFLLILVEPATDDNRCQHGPHTLPSHGEGLNVLIIIGTILRYDLHTLPFHGEGLARGYYTLGAVTRGFGTNRESCVLTKIKHGALRAAVSRVRPDHCKFVPL
jgi:hypothetical protein